jgi:hypothetical protein
LIIRIFQRRRDYKEIIVTNQLAEAKVMQKERNQNEPYSVSISDWITILQDKTSTYTNLFIFLASTVIGMIIVVPQIVRDSMGSGLLASVMLLLLLGLLYLVFLLTSRKSKQVNKPYKELYNKIILGEITDPKKIRDEYKKIPDTLKNKENFL